MNSKIEALVANIEKVIVGKQETVLKIVTAMLCGGHVLIEDVPGVGKTQLVSALARSVAGKFNRIQLTPDVMPSDIVGFSMINQVTRELEYKEGAAMCNFLLADEINRASPKSQSSLLEIMEEHQISIDGVTHSLPVPFMTLATQNPVETYGTYHLPEAQMDRFIMKISMGYPAYEDELRIMSNGENLISAKDLRAVMSTDDIAVLMEEAQKVATAPSIRKYILDIVTATRNSEYIKLGVSPRGSIALLRAVKSYAYVMGRSYVIPDDVKSVMVEVLAHRLMLSPKGKSNFEDNGAALKAVAMTVQSPTTAE
ncbi:MAG: MoxR family ATPase [Ruminococcus sp.]|uniref:MoxR-like ATPase n=1 Tax=Ruminococcus albus TaxID=1264 RepID=A0A1H7L9J7_RUMAL|nr:MULTISPECIES: MoxR family ATPase [Ruminococcus]MBO4865088.1 MoxR family ATPase [Ruminococcus sp.]SEK95621.1 MoxR-like ATPase [Ruminococcus albus]